MISDIVEWPSGPVKLVWRDTNSARLPTTGVHGFFFQEGAILLCDILGRGLTIPGGHIDEGESTEDCLRREALEEACVELSYLTRLGFIEADHRSNREYSGSYPTRSVQAIYRAEIITVHDLTAVFESSKRIFADIEQVPMLHHEWNQVLQAAFDAATGISAATGSSCG